MTELNGAIIILIEGIIAFLSSVSEEANYFNKKEWIMNIIFSIIMTLAVAYVVVSIEMNLLPKIIELIGFSAWLLVVTECAIRIKNTIK